MVRRAPRGARGRTGRWPRAGRAFVAAVVVFVLAAGAVSAQQPTPPQSEVDRLLFEAVSANDMARVRATIAEGADPNALDESGRTPADVAVDRGYFDIAHFLLSTRNLRRAPPPPPPPPVPKIAAESRPAPPPAPRTEPQATLTVPAPKTDDPWSGTIAVPRTAESSNTAKTDAPATTPRPAVKVPGARKPRLAMPTSPVPPAPPLAAARDAQWPSDQPNPFDPKTVAPGTQVPVVGEIRGPGSDPRVPAEPPSPDELGPAAADAPAEPPSPPTETAATAGPVVPSPSQTDRPTRPKSETTPEADRPAPPSSETAPAAGHGPEESGFLKRLADFLTPGSDDQATTTPRPRPSATATQDDRVSSDDAPPPPTDHRGTETAKGPPAPETEVVATTPPAPTMPPPTETPADASADASANAAPTAAAGEADAPSGTIGKFVAGLTSWFKGKPVRAPPPDPEVADREADDGTADAGPPSPTEERPAAALPSTPDVRDSGRRATAARTPDKPGDATAGDAGTVTAKTPLAAQEETADKATEEESKIATEKGPADKAAADEATVAVEEEAAEEATVAVEEEAAKEARGADEKPGMVRRLFGRLSGLFGRGDESATETAAAEEAKPPAAADKESVATARSEQTVPATKASDRPLLRGVNLALGDTFRLGRRLDASQPPAGGCLTKRAFNAVFCVEALDWPASLAPTFDIHSGLYAGPRAVTRYDAGVASGAHVLYPTAAFAQVVDHFTKRYGPPNESAELMMAMIGEPRRANATVRWVAATDGGIVEVLEVRTFDDTRGTLPDLLFGVVRLYRDGAPSVFRHLSTGDLLVLNMKRIGKPRDVYEEADLPPLAPAKPTAPEPKAPRTAPKKPTTGDGAAAPAPNAAADPAKKADAILPPVDAPVPPAAPNLAARAAPLPPPSFPLPPRKPRPAMASKDGARPIATETTAAVREGPPEEKPSPATETKTAADAADDGKPADTEIAALEASEGERVKASPPAPQPPSSRPPVAPRPEAGTEAPEKDEEGDGEAAARAGVEDEKAEEAVPSTSPAPAQEDEPTRQAAAGVPAPPPPPPEPAGTTTAGVATSDLPVAAAVEKKTPPRQGSAKLVEVPRVPPPPPETEESATTPAPKAEFWDRLSNFLKLGKKKPAPAETIAEEAGGKTEETAAATTGQATDPTAATDTKTATTPDPWAPKVTLMREKAKKKGVDSIVSPETPARLPAPPLQQEVAVSVPPSPAPPSAEKAPAGPVAEKETEPRQAAAPQSGPMSSSASAAPAEGGAGNAPKDDAIARSDGPRLPLIALPDRRFFRQLGNFLLRREGGSVRKPTPEAEAARMAGSLPQTTPDEAADDVVRLPDDGDTGEADEPDAAGAPIDESADAEKRTPAVATDEETTTPRAPPSLPTLADRSSSAPGPRKALEIPPAAKTAAPPSRVRRGHRRRG